MAEQKFSEPSYKSPIEGEYVGVADKAMVEFAPSLPAEIRGRLASRIAASIISEGSRDPDLLIEEDPVLCLNRSWVWPELEKLCPFRLDADFDVQNWNLWDPEPWIALSDAKRLRSYVESMTLDDWVWNCPMTQVREWRDELLPDRPKRGRKMELLYALLNSPGFKPIAVRDYNIWRDVQLEEVARLTAKSQQAPVAHHLAWLVRLVWIRLDNYHTLKNSWDGPKAFQEIQQTLIAAANSQVRPIHPDELNDELTNAFSFLGSGSIRMSGRPERHGSKAMLLAKQYLIAMNARLTPEGVAEALSPYRPARMVMKSPCRACSTQQTKTGNADAGVLAPYHLLCTCSGFRWLPEKFEGSLHDWDFGAKVDRNASMWALDRLLGVNDAQLDVIALATRVSIREMEDDIERKVSVTMAARKRKGRG